MTVKINPNTNIPLASVPDPVVKADLKKYDTHVADDNIDAPELKAYLTDKLGPNADVEIGSTDVIQSPTVYPMQSYDVLSLYTPTWKGDFHVDGYGAGNVEVGRTNYGVYDPTTGKMGTPVDKTQILVNCNLMDKNVIANLKDAKAVFMVPGSDVQIEVPLTKATADGYQSYSRGGPSTWVPEKKYLGVSLDTASLNKLGGGADLNFYIRLQTGDNKTLWINKDGKAGNNFTLSAGDMTPPAAI